MDVAIRNRVPNDPATLAVSLGYPDRLDQVFREQIFSKMPDKFLKPIGEFYQETYLKSGRREANLMLLDIQKNLTKDAIRLSSSNDELVLFAKRRAETCAKALARTGCLENAYKSICRIVKSFGLKVVKHSGKYSLYGAVMRMVDDKWWRRAIRKTHGRKCEGLAIKLGLVSKRKGIYASDDAVARRSEQKTRTSQMLETMVAVNELEQSYTLKELQDLSVSNPSIRRAELMTRIAGFEEYAIKHGHVGEFITITCPSRMHARHYKSGDQNSKYDGITPDKSQKYLDEQWCKIRAVLKRQNIDIYGMRVVEPQHDGTPHWHMLIFMEPECVDPVRSIMSRYALEIDGDERGAKDHRFTAVSIDWGRGTAAGYIAKYISKNIDGYGVDEDLHGNDAKQSAIRVDAWASTWGIRQFQQIGGPPVTIWRVLRSLSDVPENELASRAYQAADEGDWCLYMEIMGGHSILRKDWPICLAKQNNDQVNSYGEPIGQVVVGVCIGKVVYMSKIHIWTITPKTSCDIPYMEDCYVNDPLHNVTLREKDPLRNVYVTANSENSVPANYYPLEFCQ